MHEFLIFVLGVVAGTFVAIGLDTFRYYYYRPRLEITGNRPEVSDKFTCESIIVRNIGRRIAAHCQGFITFEHVEPLDVTPDSQILLGKDVGLDPIKFGVSMEETIYLRDGSMRVIEDEPLCWSSVDSRSTTEIFPQNSRLLDVCRLIKIEGKHQIHIPSSLGWQALLVSLKPRKYDIWIRIAAEDAPILKEKFSIQYNGHDIRIQKA